MTEFTTIDFIAFLVVAAVAVAGITFSRIQMKDGLPYKGGR